MRKKLVKTCKKKQSCSQPTLGKCRPSIVFLLLAQLEKITRVKYEIYGVNEGQFHSVILAIFAAWFWKYFLYHSSNTFLDFTTILTCRNFSCLAKQIFFSLGIKLRITYTRNCLIIKFQSVSHILLTFVDEHSNSLALVTNYRKRKKKTQRVPPTLFVEKDD